MQHFIIKSAHEEFISDTGFMTPKRDSLGFIHSVELPSKVLTLEIAQINPGVPFDSNHILKSIENMEELRVLFLDFMQHNIDEERINRVKELLGI